MLVFGGIPLFYMELALGQYYRTGAITCWARVCPLFKGIYKYIYFVIAVALVYINIMYSTADDWPKVLSLRTLLVRSVQHLVTYTKMFVCMSSFRIRLMTSSLISTNGVTTLEPYIPFIKDY